MTDMEKCLHSEPACFDCRLAFTAGAHAAFMEAREIASWYWLAESAGQAILETARARALAAAVEAEETA
jgi:hypothetical protein